MSRKFSAVIALAFGVIFFGDYSEAAGGRAREAIGISNHHLFLFVFALFLSALALALHRHRIIIKLNKKLMSAQALEINFYEQALDAHAIVTFSDNQHKLLSVNEKFVEEFGYQPIEVIGKSPAFLYPGNDNSTEFRAINKATAAGKIWSGDQKVETKSGAIRYMKCTVMPLFDGDGNRVKNIAIRTDVTDSHRIEANRFLIATLEKFRDGICIYDVESLKISFMNEVALHQTEWSTREAYEKTIVEALGSVDFASFKKMLTPLLTGARKSVVIETTQNMGPVEIDTHLLSDSQGKPKFVSVIRDVSQRKQAERAKAEIVSVVSHELRTPITSILGGLRLIQSGKLGELEPKTASIIDIAERNSVRLLNIANDILDDEKAQPDNAEKLDVLINLSDLVAEAVEANKGYGYDAGVTITGSGLNSPAYVCGFSDRLLQVMANLLSNGVKYSPQGGNVSIVLEDAGDQWRVSVSDNGPGIPKRLHKMIFDNYSQPLAADGKKRPGTGLGLAITKKILQNHGGCVNLESVVGEGTTFFFELPKQEAHDSTSPINPVSVAAE